MSLCLKSKKALKHKCWRKIEMQKQSSDSILTDPRNQLTSHLRKEETSVEKNGFDKNMKENQ